MSPNVCHWNFLPFHRNIGPSTFMLTFGFDSTSTTEQQLRAREYVDIEARTTAERTSPSDPFHDLALMSLVKRPSRVVPLRPSKRYQQERVAIISQTPVPRGRFLHIFHICRVSIWNTRASSLEFCSANAHRIVYNNIWTSYIRQNNVRSEAGRRGSLSACVSGCHHADWNFTTISRPKDDTPHKMKRDMLLHNVGTHQVEDHLDVCSDDARPCAKQNELRTLELPISKRDMQVADSVSTAGPRANFVTLSTSSCSNKVCWNTCARYASRAHYVTYRLFWVCKAPSASSVQSSSRRG